MQLRFAAQFVLFLVGTAGLSLTLLRAGPQAWTGAVRIVLAGGFLALAAGSFLDGALIIDEPDAPLTLALRGAGALALAVGAVLWRERGIVRAALALCAVLLLASLPIATGVAGSGLTIAAGAALAYALWTTSRRSIAARVAASGAATLLVLVLVLSVALSAVLSATVEREQLDQIETRALGEATEVEDSVRADVVPAARLVAASLEGDPDELASLLRVADAPAPDASIARSLSELSRLFLSDRALAYVTLDGTVVGTASDVQAAVDAVATSGLVQRVLESARTATGQRLSSRPERSGLVVAGDALHSVAVTVTGGRNADGTFRPLGAVLALRTLDDEYLSAQRRDVGQVAFAVVAPAGVLAASPAQEVPLAELRAAAASVLRPGGASASRQAPEHYLAARRIDGGDGSTAAAFVVAAPASVVDDTRARLFQTLFLIALGGTLLALLLAALVGDRIGSRLRRLTATAGAVRGGDLDVRADIDSEDEVGVLGDAFDAMVATLQDRNAALRQAAEDEARLRNRLEAIVEGMGEALVAVDPGGMVTDVNGAAEDLLGRDRDHLVGAELATVLALVDEEDGADLTSRLVTDQRTVWSASGLLGASVPVAVTSGPLLDADGDVAGAVALLRDLRTERAVEQVKREFLSRVGHELRTPLTIIRGYAQTLASRPVPPERAVGMHDAMLQKSRELERIIQMLEFFASTGGGGTQLRAEPLDVRSIAAEAVTAWNARLGREAVALRQARRVPPVLADAAWLRRVVDELVDNAVKFSDGGDVVVSVRRGEGTVDIAVRDRGRGMTEEELGRVFADFVQGDTSDTRSYGGLGLGLSMVQRVVEAHGGVISVDSAPGKGTEVVVALPTAS